MFMFINLKETAFNYCAQWSDVDNQKIDCSIISRGAIMAATRRNGFH